MLQIIIEGMAACVGGYLSELAQNKQISIKKLFIYSLFLMLLICLIFACVSKNFSLETSFITVCLSFCIAALVTLLVYISIHRQRK